MLRSGQPHNELVETTLEILNCVPYLWGGKVKGCKLNIIVDTDLWDRLEKLMAKSGG